MEQLVKTVLSQYTGYDAEVKLLKCLLPDQETPETKTSLALHEQKMAAIHSWLTLLKADERLVIQKHLIEELGWSEVAIALQEHWNHEFAADGRTMMRIQTNALQKMVAFCAMHNAITMQMFGHLRNADAK